MYLYIYIYIPLEIVGGVGKTGLAEAAWRERLQRVVREQLVPPVAFLLGERAAGCRPPGWRICGPKLGPPSYIPIAPSGLSGKLGWRMDYGRLNGSWVMT